MKNKTPKLTIKNLIPSLGVGGCNFGFLFGAGSSAEAGYPLTSELTHSVINKLSVPQKGFLLEIFNNYNSRFSRSNYSIEENLPDIEFILNLINEGKFLCTTEKIQKVFEDLDYAIKDFIVDELLLIKEPILEPHVEFLSSIKSIIGKRGDPFWIFTTNYDLLFETSAMHSKVPLRNGFEGCGARYFDIQRIKLKTGLITKDSRHSNRFEDYREPYFNLIKLHGSISWYKDENLTYELFDKKQIKENYKRILIHPQNCKITQTLENPYDQLFHYASGTIGNQCKYLVSCGYSYRDKHINDRLLIPKLKTGSLRIFALFEDEPENISLFKKYGGAFNYLSKEKLYMDGIEYDYPNELWKFSNLVKFLTI